MTEKKAVTCVTRFYGLWKFMCAGSGSIFCKLYCGHISEGAPRPVAASQSSRHQATGTQCEARQGSTLAHLGRARPKTTTRQGSVCRGMHWQFCREMHEPNMSVGISSWVSPLVSPNQPTHIAAPSTRPQLNTLLLHECWARATIYHLT